MYKISIIVAIANNNAIGFKNNLLTNLPNDLKWFKQNTLNKTIIMGRKTFESLPNGALPKRKNIVLTTNTNFIAENCIIVNKIDDIWQHLDNQSENFIIGGSEIYKQFINQAKKLYITRIYGDFNADVFFPEINFNNWDLKEKIENKTDEKHKYDYDFFIYERT
ncbi:MAG: dihydrofolate reductase [Bacteroidales bacterium]|nr:dihydrofolate reductase [Bacteroidales bacterium]